MRLGTLLLLPSAALAFQLPFTVPQFFRAKTPLQQVEEPPIHSTPRIAIIGAGAGGSSAAFWISKAKQRFGIDVEIDVYEKRGYIGGRSTVVFPYENDTLPELELGASIFVKANKNLWRASDEFNLTRRDFADDDGEMGVWDGEKLLFTFNGGWWDTAKLLWRYGYFPPKRTNDIVQSMIARFVELYTPEAPRWDNISDLATSFEWTSLVGQTTSEYLASQGVSDQYIKEFVEAATRVNYGQNVDELHALEGLCSMATSGAAGIKGGNFQIFEKFLQQSGANVHLDTTVTSITQKPGSNRWTLRTNQGSTTHYKAVIIAAPIHQTRIELPADLLSQVPQQPYVNLHVTLLTTTSPTASPAYFGLAESATVPSMMLTTNQGVRQGGKQPEFNSLSYHGQIREGEWAVKIFSKEQIGDEWLQAMFNNTVSWTYRTLWKAYPKLPPTTEFPPVKLDRGIYYVNAFEPFISTMETETIASRNVVDLLLSDEFNSGICGSRISGAPDAPAKEKTNEDFVLGWDC